MCFVLFFILFLFIMLEHLISTGDLSGFCRNLSEQQPPKSEEPPGEPSLLRPYRYVSERFLSGHRAINLLADPEAMKDMKDMAQRVARVRV